jgi:signal peptidase I
MTRATATKPKPPAKKTSAPARAEGHRDTVEQVVVAFILAFIVRGFTAEAFVIPTGSMAPTLMGRHKEITCPECGQVYQVNASDEAESALNSRNGQPIELGTCQSCRYKARIDEEASFKGDRILVMKFLYSLPFLPGGGGPKRWDVVVFKYPEEPEQNYIKRLVGMPNEELRVYFGNILTRPAGSDAPFHIERRPLFHQQAMQMLVYDDAHRPKHLAGDPSWRRWQTAGAWKEGPEGQFTSGESGEWSRLGYHHFVPTQTQWEAILTGKGEAGPPQASLITDFYSYNSLESASSEGHIVWSNWYQPHWVGDLTLSCRVEPTASSGLLRLELVRGGVTNRCEIDLATGMGSLHHGDTALGAPAQTGLKGNSVHDVTFANVDGRLTLWVDGALPFGDGLAYDDLSGSHPIPTGADLQPVGIATKGARLKVSGLVLKRDIYYTQVPGESDFQALGGSVFDQTRPQSDLVKNLSDPGEFSVYADLKPKDYPIHPGHYMMMGDNSPKSKDGRGWHQTDQINPSYPEYGWDPNHRESWEVPGSLLIGKAFFVYWPHGKPFGPEAKVSRDIRFPFRPYIERMKWIR